MLKSALQNWEQKFRRDAKADKMATFREHMHRLNLRGKPELMLEGTILMIQACYAYAKMDGVPFAAFLKTQKYKPALQGVAKYAFTFDLCGKAFARVLVSEKLKMLDLADMYGHPWQDYKMCGYNRLWITRTDSKPLKSTELEKFEQYVTNDLRYDYSEDELDFWFDDSQPDGALYVYVYDHEDT
jgi:hypothetical protein